jgi:hypothetical protein
MFYVTAVMTTSHRNENKFDLQKMYVISNTQKQNATKIFKDRREVRY